MSTHTVLLSFALFCGLYTSAQPITGVWKGKSGREKLELKLVKKGDSLVGAAYYYQSPRQYRRYQVKGYFDSQTNEVVWWDDFLIEGANSSQANSNEQKTALLHVADFNCPGESEMLLEGASTLRDNKSEAKGALQLEKIKTGIFHDEWDELIDNYQVGGNDPDLIDEVARLHQPKDAPNWNEKPMPVPVLPAPEMVATKPSTQPTAIPEAQPATGVLDVTKQFTERSKKLQTVIPLGNARKIVLRFYDNAEVDGDSIALFLNQQLIFKHIRLTDKAYEVTIDVADLEADNELVMVAENLGSIPPNTSYMVAIVGDKQYEARLYANEHMSALIRLIK